MRQFALPAPCYGAATLAADDLTPVAERRAALLAAWHRLRAKGLTAHHAAEGLGVPYATLYRWDRQVRTQGVPRFHDRSRRPHHIPRPPRDLALVARIQALRTQFPRWGKDRLVCLLRREGWNTSATTVGRVLTDLRRRGLLHPRAVSRPSGGARCAPTPSASPRTTWSPAPAI